MLKMVKYWPLVLLFILASCAITDQQIEDIVGAVEGSTRALVDTGITVAAPSVDGIAPGASGGIAAIVALGAGYLVRLLLKTIRRKKEE